MGKKFCMECEEEIPRDSLFCPKCGAQLKRIGESETDLPKEEKAYSEKTPTKKSNGKMIAAGVIGIVVLMAIVSLFLSSNSPETGIEGNVYSAADYYNEGLSLYDQGKLQQAITKFENALEIDPNYKEAWVYKGLALDDLERYSEALICYDKAIALDPNYIVPWYNKGIILGNQGNYEGAITCFDKIIAINPNDAEAWNNKGTALELLGRLTEAQACYQKAKQLGYTG